MSSFFDKLNLKPGERRLVIFVGIVVFIIVNAVFVWPRFGDWGKIKKRQRESTDLLKAFQEEIAKTPRYKKQLEDLQKAGAEVKSDYQSSKMQSTIYNQAALSGVQVNRYDAGSARASSAKPNQFFEEQLGMITVTTEEKSLIDFLYNLGSGGSLIRVRTMSLSPDPARQKLMGTLNLVASYQKPAPVKAAPAGTSTKPGTATTAPAAPRSAGSTNTMAKPGFASSRSTNAMTAKTNVPPKK